MEICGELPSTASYHFSHTRPESTQSDDAFRAIACQLLQNHRHDHLVLDATCLLLRKTSCREKATIDEVLEVLGLLLRQHPTFLVIDGADECNSLETFLTSLAGLCCKSDTKVILFSRPDIRIPLDYQKWASDAPHILSLTHEHNAASIEYYVARELNHMADKGFFGISMDRTLIPRVARTSNGVFLWASVLLDFLQSPTLSSDDRYAVLENTQSLESLQSLYRKVLTVLAHQPRHEKNLIADVFRWLSFSIGHLSPLALRNVLSAHSGSSEESYSTDLTEALPELSCGLLHVSNDTVYFSHRSICEYLKTPLSQDFEFSLHDESSTHAHLARRCLIYLAHNVPKRPLGGLRSRNSPILPTMPPSSGASLYTSKSGDSGYKSLSSSDVDNNAVNSCGHVHHNNVSRASIRKIPFDTHLQFLRYAALCWPIHLSRALSDGHTYRLCGLVSTLSLFLPALNAFLSSRLAITAWVEASFRYNLPPTLTRLVSPLSDLKAEIPPSTAQGKELRLVVNDIRMLSERLIDLKRECATSLRENPSLIWQQVDTAGGEQYWPVWDNGMNGSG